jgi:hypothetical protein
MFYEAEDVSEKLSACERDGSEEGFGGYWCERDGVCFALRRAQKDPRH